MKVLMWEHKHGTRLFDASTPEALEASAREILRRLIDMQYIYEPEDPLKHIVYSGIDMEQAQLSDEQIALLPTVSLRDEAFRHKRALERRFSTYEDDKEYYATACAVASGETVLDGTRSVTAWRLLQGRDGEYERFELETVWSVSA